MSTIVITGGNSDIAKAIYQMVLKKFPKKKIYLLNRSMLDVTDVTAAELTMGAMKPVILINCAGYIYPQSIAQSDPEQWFKEIYINLFGAYNVSRAAVRYGAKTIINIGSTAGTDGRKNWSGYAASKAGLINFTESLIKEGVNAYCLNIGRTNTKMRKALFPDEDPRTLIPVEGVAALVEMVLDREFKPGQISLRVD